MNGISNALNGLYDISGVEVGQHFYWQIAGFQVHAQVLITSWVVIAILLGSAVIAVRNPQTIPTAGQNFFEYVLEFIRDVSKTQIGEEYGPWVPFIGTMFLFIFVSNWSGALLPWKIIQLPHGELAAPTNDINTTVALALLTLVAYFYAGLSKKGLGVLSPLVFFPISTHFTAPPEIPSAPTVLQLGSFHRLSKVEPWDLTADLKSHLQTLYAQSFRITLASSVLSRLLAQS
ncbi:hypothetical protein ES319_A05G089400v1 [Gossypium barbadense]|uniref:ATP synthase subunit a, chloroplastic n=1 Tax=Gossypium barbadense TaxID=3634 RepID=A0A5J5VLU3_GOSBA|nr:hypothetical protein ES319_A05G089400v1 [Gossypium barbadense]